MFIRELKTCAWIFWEWAMGCTRCRHCYGSEDFFEFSPCNWASQGLFPPFPPGHILEIGPRCDVRGRQSIYEAKSTLGSCMCLGRCWTLRSTYWVASHCWDKAFSLSAFTLLEVYAVTDATGENGFTCHFLAWALVYLTLAAWCWRSFNFRELDSKKYWKCYTVAIKGACVDSEKSVVFDSFRIKIPSIYFFSGWRPRQCNCLMCHRSEGPFSVLTHTFQWILHWWLLRLVSDDQDKVLKVLRWLHWRWSVWTTLVLILIPLGITWKPPLCRHICAMLHARPSLWRSSLLVQVRPRSVTE